MTDPLESRIWRPTSSRSRAPHAYEIFQRKQDGAIKILLEP